MIKKLLKDKQIPQEAWEIWLVMSMVFTIAGVILLIFAPQGKIMETAYIFIGCLLNLFICIWLGIRNTK